MRPRGPSPRKCGVAVQDQTPSPAGRPTGADCARHRRDGGRPDARRRPPDQEWEAEGRASQAHRPVPNHLLRRPRDPTSQHRRDPHPWRSGTPVVQPAGDTTLNSWVRGSEELRVVSPPGRAPSHASLGGPGAAKPLAVGSGWDLVLEWKTRPRRRVEGSTWSRETHREAR